MSLLAEKIHCWALEALRMKKTGDAVADRLFTSYAVNPAPQSDYLPYYRFLTVAMKNVKPALAVELGVERGVGTAHMAAGYCSGTIVGVDIAFDDVAYTVAEHYDCIHYVKGDSIATSGELGKFSLPIGLLFVDSLHTAAHVRKEIKAYEPLLADEALVLIDNLYHPHQSGTRQVYEAFYEFPHLRLELSELSPAWGFGAAIFKR
jgi:predicted O-methyltransferase YrrM